MRRPLPRLAAVAAVCTVAFAILPINAEEKDKDPANDQLVVVVYPVGDLPVWSLDVEDDDDAGFDPTILTALIKTTIDPESWSNGRLSVSPYETMSALVIYTTRSNHKQIADLFEMLRGKNSDEEKETLSQSRNDDRIRIGVLNTIFRAERQQVADAAQAIKHLDTEIKNVIDADLSPSREKALLHALRRHRRSIFMNQFHRVPAAEKSGRPMEPLVDGAMILPGQFTSLGSLHEHRFAEPTPLRFSTDGPVIDRFGSIEPSPTGQRRQLD